jgi:hypothetical protein
MWQAMAAEQGQMAGMAALPVMALTKRIKGHSIRSSRRHQRREVFQPLLMMLIGCSDSHAEA